MKGQWLAWPVLLLALAGCTAWHVETAASPLVLVGASRPKAVRISFAGDSSLVLSHPVIIGADSIVGVNQDGSVSIIPVSSVRSIATSHTSGAKTGLLLLGLGALGLGVGVAIAVSSMGPVF